MEREDPLSEVEEIKKALNDLGYSPKTIKEIMKKYELFFLPINQFDGQGLELEV